MIINSDGEIKPILTPQTAIGPWKFRVKDTPTIKQLEAQFTQRLAGFPFLVDHWMTGTDDKWALGYVVKEDNQKQGRPARIPCAIHVEDLEEVAG
jgi:hypothetical protein